MIILNNRFICLITVQVLFCSVSGERRHNDSFPLTLFQGHHFQITEIRFRKKIQIMLLSTSYLTFLKYILKENMQAHSWIRTSKSLILTLIHEFMEVLALAVVGFCSQCLERLCVLCFPIGLQLLHLGWGSSRCKDKLESSATERGLELLVKRRLIKIIFIYLNIIFFNL